MHEKLRRWVPKRNDPHERFVIDSDNGNLLAGLPVSIVIGKAGSFTNKISCLTSFSVPNGKGEVQARASDKSRCKDTNCRSL